MEHDYESELKAIDELIVRQHTQRQLIDKELSTLHNNRLAIIKERNASECRKVIAQHIKFFGNIVQGYSSHNTLRKTLVPIIYKDLGEHYSYDLLMGTILDNAKVDYEYLSKKGIEDIKLQINLSEGD